MDLIGVILWVILIGSLIFGFRLIYESYKVRKDADEYRESLNREKEYLETQISMYTEELGIQDKLIEGMKEEERKMDEYRKKKRVESASDEEECI